MTDQAGAVTNQRWLALDAARGVAAIAVMTFHLHNYGPDPVAAGYRGVDFFFILSGFVIAHAYEARLRGAMSFRDFAVVRFRRLYPLYMLGTVIGLAQLLVQQTAGWHDPVGVAFTLGTSLLMLPGHIGGIRLIYPLNGSAWSLMYELLINAVFALVARWLKPLILFAIVGVGVAGLVLVAALHHELSVGSKWNRIGIPGGVARVTFSFFMGVLIYRFRPKRVFRSDLATLVLVVVPALLCTVGAYDWRYDLPIDVLLLPALVWAGAAVQPRSSVAVGLATLSGGISYGLYALHYPILLWTAGFIGGRVDPRLAMLITGAIALAVAYLATHYFDEPVRRWWSQRSKVKGGGASAATTDTPHEPTAPVVSAAETTAT